MNDWIADDEARARFLVHGCLQEVVHIICAELIQQNVA